MPAKKAKTRGWPVQAANAPKLSNSEWGLAAVPGVVLLLMAVLHRVPLCKLCNGCSCRRFLVCY
jgi:hypothetical protein